MTVVEGFKLGKRIFGGLLGSPCFEIPRSVQRDSRFDHLKTGEEFRRRLAAKNRHNAVTIGLFTPDSTGDLRPSFCTR